MIGYSKDIEGIRMQIVAGTANWNHLPALGGVLKISRVLVPTGSKIITGNRAFC